jgi:glycine cleavage system H protein
MATVRGLSFPDELYYYVSHNVWLRREPDGIVTVGVTELAGKLAGDFLAFVPKRVGSNIEQGRALGVLEISKVITSVRSPLSGQIVATNEDAEAKPWLINSSPYGAGWLVKLKPRDWVDESAVLITGEAIAASFEKAMELEGYVFQALDEE